MPADLDDDEPAAGGVNRDRCCSGVLMVDDEETLLAPKDRVLYATADDDGVLLCWAAYS
jgi:hypothetical protein